LPVLAASQLGAAATESGRPGWLQALIVLGAIAGLIVGGRLLVRPAFRLIAAMHLRESLTAAALLLVLGTTALMQMVGLSPALGAFLAGVVLADSEFRHQIEADLEPFKALLLGLFFISIGAGVDLGLVAAKPFAIVGIVACLLLFKGAIVFALGRFSRMSLPDSVLLGVSLAQGGEFAFVLLKLALDGGLLPTETTQLITAAVAVSMAAAPLLIAGTIKWVLPRLERHKTARADDEIGAHDSHAVVVGIGRFGQVVVRLLRANGFRTTVLDYDEDQIKVMEQFGISSYFGDATRESLLRAAGLDRVSILVLAIDDAASCEKIVELVRHEFPRVKIFARAFDRVHAYKLLNAGVTSVAIETGGSAVDLGVEVLQALGFAPFRAHRQGGFFHKRNRQTIVDMAPRFGKTEQEAWVREVRQRTETLEDLMRSEGDRHGSRDREWESAPRS
jgi:voltage-gated potassium channel Kch